MFEQQIQEAHRLEAAHFPGRAEAILRECVKRAPSDPEACRELGMLLMRWGAASKGAPFLVRAVNAAPDRPELWYELGMCCALAEQYRDSAAALERGIAIAPGQAPLYQLLGQVLCRSGRFGEAIGVIVRGLQIEPTNPLLAQGLILSLKSLGKVDEAAMHADRFAALHGDDPEMLRLAAWQCTYASQGDPALIREWLERRGRIAWPSAPSQRFDNIAEPGRRLRVGFVCQDIRKDSPIARFIDAPLTRLDPSQFEVFGYLTQGSTALMARRLIEAVGERGWTDVSKIDDAALAARVRADAIDVLVDVAGNTDGNRQGAFALRAAPVQVTCIGDPRTTGNPTMDWRVVDEVTDPQGAERYCTERLARLPGCFLCYAPHEDAPATRAPISTVPGANAGPITLASLNTYHKIGDAVLDAWAKILLEIPDSQLLIKSLGLRTPEVREHFYGALESRGVSRQRVLLEGEVESMRDHLAYLHKVDIALDTFPYNGTTTTCDALWMGVPVVTIAGRWHAARVGASLLTSVGLTELIARDVGDYVRIAAELARDRARLAELHGTLRGRMLRSVLCDAAGYGARVGEVYRGMWRAWCPGQ